MSDIDDSPAEPYDTDEPGPATAPVLPRRGRPPGSKNRPPDKRSPLTKAQLQDQLRNATHSPRTKATEQSEIRQVLKAAGIKIATTPSPEESRPELVAMLLRSALITLLGSIVGGDTVLMPKDAKQAMEFLKVLHASYRIEQGLATSITAATSADPASRNERFAELAEAARERAKLRLVPVTG